MQSVKIRITQEYPDQFVDAKVQDSKDVLTTTDIFEACLRAMRAAGYYPLDDETFFDVYDAAMDRKYLAERNADVP